MLGMLVVGADSSMSVRRSALRKALEPLEALALKVERAFENGAPHRQTGFHRSLPEEFKSSPAWSTVPAQLSLSPAQILPESGLVNHNDWQMRAEMVDKLI